MRVERKCTTEISHGCQEYEDASEVGGHEFKLRQGSVVVCILLAGVLPSWTVFLMTVRIPAVGFFLHTGSMFCLTLDQSSPLCYLEWPVLFKIQLYWDIIGI